MKREARSVSPWELPGFFVIRTPLLPMDTFTSWAADVEAPAQVGDAEALEGALARDRARLRARLEALLARPEILEALFLSSPRLFDRLDAWRHAPESVPAVENTVVRYISRMAGRPEPLGLLAGYSVGRVGGLPRLMLGGIKECRRHTRLAMEYLCELAHAIGCEPSLQAALRYRPNSSLVRVASTAFFYQTRFGSGPSGHRPVSCDVDEGVAAALDRAAAGATALELEVTVEASGSAAPGEAKELVQDLIAGQLLVPELMPAATGAEPIDGLIRQLEAHPSAAPLAARLSAVRTRLAELDAAGLGADPMRYLDISRMLDGLPAVTPDPSRLFRVDFTRPAPTVMLDDTVLAEIARGVDVMHRLGSTRTRRTSLSAFAEAFVSRYGTRGVRLVEALSPETGIGYLPRGEQDTDPEHGGAAEASAPLELLAEKIGDALRRGQREIALDDASLRQAEASDPMPLPSALSVVATVLAESEAALARGEFQVALDGFQGPAGARLISRFSLADPALHEAIVQHLRAEEALEPDAIFAEVVHLPGGQVDNLVCRTVLRSYEIPYLARSGAAEEAQLPVGDLRVSVEDGRICLWSERLGKRVLPRLTCPHLYRRSDSVGLYRFLAELQEQETDGELWWSWGPLGAMPFLPRVTHGRVILAAARWRTPAAEVATMASLPDGQRFAAVQRWRAERGIPRFVRLAQLPVDLENVLSVDSLLGRLRAGDDLILRECFAGPAELCMRTPEGPLAHELVVPLVRKRPPSAVQPVPPMMRQRRFPPGSEWLYARLYTGPTLAEPVLDRLARSVIAPAFAAAGADRWFFIRFGDPDWHLRVRVRGDAARLRSDLLPALSAAAEALLDEGQVWRVQLDTYESETQRYGGPEGLELAEQLFHADSDAVVELLRELQGSSSDTERWRFAFRSVDQLLADLGLELHERLGVVSGLAAPLEGALRRDAVARRQTAERFRREREVLEAITFAPETLREAQAPLEATLLRRSQRILPLAGELRSLEARGRLSVLPMALAPSFVHMHLNRLLRTAHRSQEQLLGHFLARLYTSRLARARGVTEG